LQQVIGADDNPGEEAVRAADPEGVFVEVAACAVLSVGSVSMREIFSGSGAQGKKKIDGAY
jgi:hypothetical protein